MMWLLGTLFILICLLLIFMVVITPSNEGGMAAAFGGMGGDSFFGTRGHQTINKFTVFLAVSFLVLAIGINLYNAKQKAATQTPIEDTINKAAPAPDAGIPGLPGGTPPPTPAPAPK